MFRIFRSGYGNKDIVPYHFGDGVMFLVFGLVAVLMMFWLAVAAAPVMYLPMLAIQAGLLLLLYLGGEEGELRGKAAYYLAYPFFAYGDVLGCVRSICTVRWPGRIARMDRARRGGGLHAGDSIF